MRGSRARKAGGGTLLLVALVVGGFFAAATLGGSAPAATAGARATAADGSIHLRMGLQRFQLAKGHRSLVARGNVVATYSANGKTQATTAEPVMLKVQTGTTCRVLHLELGELDLSLLGLIVTLTPVDAPAITLDITADSSEALGKLLCQVINAVQGGTLTKTTTKRLHRVNAVVHRRYSGGVWNLDIPLNQQAPSQSTDTTTTATTTSGPTIPPGQCQVLELVLGPLHLDLLGLIVDLNKIRLQITANPVGVLGTLFCQLAGTTSTPTITAP
jgi:hypothetical protein